MVTFHMKRQKKNINVSCETFDKDEDICLQAFSFLESVFYSYHNTHTNEVPHEILPYEAQTGMKHQDVWHCPSPGQH